MSETTIKCQIGTVVTTVTVVHGSRAGLLDSLSDAVVMTAAALGVNAAAAAELVVKAGERLGRK